MNTPHTFKNNIALNIINPPEVAMPLVYGETGTGPSATEYIRFEERKELYTWVHTDEILFVKSADHYVKSLVQCGKQKKWMSRHCTLKELLVILPSDNFIRLNKFYLLNRNYFSHIDEVEKILYFKDGFSAPVPHRISPFLRRLLKAPVREMHFTK